VSDSYDLLTLLKLIEKIILKQSDNQYKIGIIMEQLKLLMAYRQDDGVTNAARIFSPIHVLYHLLIALLQFSQSMKFSQGLFRTSGKRTWGQLVLCMCLGLS